MKKILVVEDDDKTANVLAIRLKAAGYEVFTASDGLEGINLAIAHQPDLVLSDIWMPVGLGFSVIQRLKQLGMERIPIIFMTASKRRNLRKIAQQLGASGFLEKPYKPQELLDVIAHALRVADACLQGQLSAASAGLPGQNDLGDATL